MMNPIATRIIAKLTSTMRQQTPLVLGQNGFGADMVSTTTPALVVLLGRVDDGWLLPLFELILRMLTTLIAIDGRKQQLTWLPVSSGWGRPPPWTGRRHRWDGRRTRRPDDSSGSETG